MNKVILVGRLTKNPEVNYATASNTCIARYTLAVDRRFKKEGQQDADFINCVVFGKGAEFAQKYITKGMKIGVTGRIQTGSFTDKDGNKRYTTDVVVEEQEFTESKRNTDNAPATPTPSNSYNGNDGFMKVPDNAGDDFPFL